MSIDISGQYAGTPRGNLYIVNFEDWLTNCPEAYAVPDTRSQTVSDLILTEILPRYGAQVQLVTDNRPGNVNKIMTEALASINTMNVITFPYHPQSNAKVGRFHGTLGVYWPNWQRIMVGIGTCI